ncbi:TOP1 [Mytilus coruscus]|uniref:TOP1 n=1 Tax=Mytilus coruscus TaxID=42192 RepID=A0A6J8BZ10_MYTCO|nr:TOP1 [Mytilus coruscus]
MSSNESPDLFPPSNDESPDDFTPSQSTPKRRHKVPLNVVLFRKTRTRKIEEEISPESETDEDMKPTQRAVPAKDDRKTKKRKIEEEMSPKSETDEDMKPTQRAVPAKDDRKTKKRKVEEEMSQKSETDEDMKPTLRAVPAKDEGVKPTLTVVPIKPRRNRKYVNCTECGTPQQNIWRHMQKVHKTKVKKPRKVISKRGYVTYFCPFTSRKTGKCQKIIERLHDHLVRTHDVKNGSKRLTTLLSMAIPVTKEDTDSEDDEMDGSDDNQPLTQLRKKPKIKQEKSELTPIIKQEKSESIPIIKQKKGDIITISDSD